MESELGTTPGSDVYNVLFNLLNRISFYSSAPVFSVNAVGHKNRPILIDRKICYGACNGVFLFE